MGDGPKCLCEEFKRFVLVPCQSGRLDELFVTVQHRRVLRLMLRAPFETLAKFCGDCLEHRLGRRAEQTCEALSDKRMRRPRGRAVDGAVAEDKATIAQPREELREPRL